MVWVLVALLVLCIVGLPPVRDALGWQARYGYYPSTILAVILFIVIAFVLLERW